MSSRQREELLVFLDRSLGKRIVAEALRQAAVKVVLHDDHFDQSTPDEVWLEEAAQRAGSF